MDEKEPVFDQSLADCLEWVEQRLLDAHAHRIGDDAAGDMPWWPAGYARGSGERAFEIAIGAVLTQNTNWRNVERALANLERADALDAATIRALPEERVGELIRPSGFYRVKARRLQALADAWERAGGWEVLVERDTAGLRAWLLGIHGVGRETADDVLLYGFERPVWVIDAYTRRLVGRLGREQLAGQAYDAMAERLLVHTREPTAARLGAWHGLVVEHAKAYCRVRPACAECPLQARCEHGRVVKGA